MMHNRRMNHSLPSDADKQAVWKAYQERRPLRVPLRRKLGVDDFDTGFPVDHGKLRAELGPEVEVSGGPEVSLLRDGSPEQCYERARSILQSGVMTGGRFILQEGNNLPPRVPLANLKAVYEACLEFGSYSAEKGATVS